MSWEKVGTGANSLAIYANRLVALTSDCKKVYMRDPGTLQWIQIGTAASYIIGGAWDLYAISPNKKLVYRFDGKDWHQISDGGIQFVGIGNALYKLQNKTRNVLRYDRYENKWTKIGNAAHSIISGGSKVYASTTDRKELYEYSRYEDKWTKIGGAGHSWVGIGGTVYGLAPNKSAVYRYNGIPMNWSKVGGASDKLIGGGSYLYSVAPGTKEIWKYNGSGTSWTKIGSPGTRIVASGDRLYSMTLDRSTVYKYTDENNEEKRLTKLLYKAFNQIRFGHRIMRGFLVKELNGEVLSEHNSDVCFQPLSVLKLIPYFHAISEIDKGNSDLDKTTVNWFQLMLSTNKVRNETGCLQSTDSNVQASSSNLKDALNTMMWFSHNRTLDAVMEHYGIVNITKRVQELGLKQTEMYYGCPHSDISVRRWPSNMTTLMDLAKLFEGVENLQFISKSSSRDVWKSNMIQAPPLPGLNYFSPIINQNTGFWNSDFLKELVKKVAGASKLGIVDEFMQNVSFRKKGGGGGPHTHETGQCDFRELSLPFKKSNGSTEIKKFLIGHYIHQRRDVNVGLKDEDKEPIAEGELQQGFKFMQEFETELYKVPLTKALATW